MHIYIYIYVSTQVGGGKEGAHESSVRGSDVYSLVCLNVCVCCAFSSLNLCVYRARLHLHVCVYRALLRMHVGIVYVSTYDPQHV